MAFGQERLPTTDEMKERFMASPHVVWDKFCEAEGLRPNMRSHYPVGAWQDEKRKIIAKRRAEELTDILFDNRHGWHKDVLKTLKEYPKIGDAIMLQINRKLEFVKSMSDERFNNGAPAVKDEKGKIVRDKQRPVSFMDLHMLSLAYKAVTEAKHKSLIIDTWSPKLAEDETKPDEIDVTEHKGFMMKVIGKGEVSLTDIEQFMAEYIDKPAVKDVET